MSPSAAAVLDAVEKLAPDIATRAGDIERDRRVPRDLLDGLRDAGCFRITVPESHGGLELPLTDVMEVVAAVARADGSTGWVVGIASDGPMFAVGLPRESFDAIYADGPDVMFGGSAAGGNVARPTDGGYVVSGRWPFASGCEHDDWLHGLAVVAPAEGTQPSEGAPPEMRILYARADAAGVSIEDTWSVVGLRGSGSHDMLFDDVFVPTELSFAMPLVPWTPAPLYRLPYFGVAALKTAAIALGIAEGSMDDLLALAATRTSTLNPSARAAGHPYFHHSVGDCDARLRAARDTLFAEAARLWNTAVRGEEFGVERGARARATAAHVVDECAMVVDELYRLGGARALYDTSPLQRRLRDVHVTTQHVITRREAVADAGAALLGYEQRGIFA